MVRKSSAAAAVLAIGLAAALAACKKSAPNEPAAPVAAPVTAGTVGSDGVRRVAVEAGAKGYQPERIAGKPGEKLMLVFTRTTDSSCLEQLKTPEGKLLDLPKGKPVEVAVTVPQVGEVGFACGMDMVTGVVVADKS
jgi:plastocyanin domain-containing protein